MMLAEEPNMLDDMEIQVQDLAIDEIRELLVEAGADISLAQAEQLAAFVAQAGGLEEALEMLAQLSTQRDAA
jgi:hypothetical protein